jgi:hypothetical protein
MIETPVLLLVFNRPSTTQLVFNRLKEIKPLKLFIATDAARPEIIGEELSCAAVRAIVSNVDWPCEAHYLFRAEHCGCKLAVSGAITWFFEQVEAGIILEDDCLPSTGFFDFCQDLLLKYKNHSHILHISGNNFQDGLLRGTGSFYFSKYVHIWGWATWRRAWQHYDLNLDHWDSFKDSISFNNLFNTQREKKYWTKKFNEYTLNASTHDYWSLQWLYTVWKFDGMVLTPQKNLVKNIGFGGGTHTTIILKHLIRDTEDLDPPYIAPLHETIDQLADVYTFKHIYAFKGTIWSRINYHLHRIIRKISS